MERILEALRRELLSLGLLENNPVVFWDKGGKEERKPRLDKITGEKEKKVVTQSVEVFSLYLEGPLFFGKVDEDLKEKERWEKAHLRKLSSAAREYYLSNRMTEYNFVPPIGCIHVLEVILKEFMSISERIPIELKKKENGMLKYYSLSLKNRAEKVKIFSDLVREGLDIISVYK